MQTSNNSSILNITEVLKSTDDDYKFILSPINNKTPEKNSRVLYIFKINPFDQNEVQKIDNVSLYFNGVQLNKVMNVLKYGYQKERDSYNKMQRRIFR